MTELKKEEESVNPSLQSDEQKEFIANLMKKTEADKIKLAQTASRNDFLKATKEFMGDEVWNELVKVKVNDKNIDEMLKENPEILDSPSMFTHTLETFKTVGLSQKSTSDPVGDKGTEELGGGANPGDVGGGSGAGKDYKVPTLASADFFKDLQDGKLTREHWRTYCGRSNR